MIREEYIEEIKKHILSARIEKDAISDFYGILGIK